MKMMVVQMHLMLANQWVMSKQIKVLIESVQLAETTTEQLEKNNELLQAYDAELQANHKRVVQLLHVATTGDASQFVVATPSPDPPSPSSMLYSSLPQQGSSAPPPLVALTGTEADSDILYSVATVDALQFTDPDSGSHGPPQ